ncbi:MAG TPA: glycosyltransferase family 2 protein [Anaerolineales bacterium]|jgi:glycosyltransferase involved in cell wall biosynthesis|nr:glycosyltransferase family 2 protein [Anaerolineales bacterium]
MARVSIIIPCFNEEKTITRLLEAIHAQDFPRKDLEVVIADGLSTDGTRKRISEFQRQHKGLDIKVLDNNARTIPAALNLAIRTAKGESIIRLDAHCIPQPDYVSKSMAALEAGRGWNVGGVWDIQPSANGWIAESIAGAASHPLGVGDAFYRYTGRAGEVDTVPFGAFRRDLIDRIGGFDETLLSNEDYEFNTRIRKAGGKVWLDPTIRSIYFARPTLSQLAKQYARYGYWKQQMLRRYPNSLRLRQALPPIFVLSLITFLIVGLIWSLALWVLLVEVVSYFAILFGAALRTALEHRKMQLSLGIPLAMATMHISWGTAFLWSIANPRR